MAFVKSNKIKVFPAAGRSSDYVEGYLTTEDNLNKSIKSLYRNGADSTTSFVITETPTLPFSFVIQGYHFEISELPSGLDMTGNLYAAIYLKTTLPANDYGRLTSQTESTDGSLDVNTEFKGLQLNRSNSFDPAEGTTIYKLRLLKDGAVPEESKLRYKSTQIFNGDTTDLISDKFSTTLLTASTVSATTVSIGGGTLTGTLTGGTLSGVTMSGGTISTSAGTISVANLMTDADITCTVSSKTLILDLDLTKGKN